MSHVPPLPGPSHENLYNKWNLSGKSLVPKLSNEPFKIIRIVTCKINVTEYKIIISPPQKIIKFLL